ncbi:anti-sigma factor [Salipaludibacillus daqingensis]|uniref:anti-sigma factor n=1 Tax=Salipaludibacillus daqingensis TaxID=3041001 RepID=UPI0024748A45|nr:anti-sigma factor [Salipaludibacillus daqingensis]
MTERMCEQVIDYFNDQLSDDDKKIFEEHLQNCESCKEELAELRELTDDLPLISEPMEPPRGMKQRVLSSVFDDETEDETTDSKLLTPIDEKVTEEKPLPVKRKNRGSAFIYGSLAAALLLSLIGNGYLWNEQQNLSQDKQQLMMERDIIESDYLALLEEEEEGTGTSDVLLTSNLASVEDEGTQGQGTATIISENGNVDLVIQVSDMPEATGTEVFQAWVIDDETPYPTGSFNIDENGNGAVTFRISDMGDFQIDQIAITLEPQPDNEQPEGQLLLASQ